MASTSTPDPAKRRKAMSQLDEGIACARNGERAQARSIFLSMIHKSPGDEDAWLWLSWVADNTQQSLAYLQEAQALLPESTRIAEAIHWAKGQLGETVPAEATAASVAPARPHKGEPSEPSLATRAAGTALQAAQSARQGAEDAFAQLKEKASGVHLRKPNWERMPPAVVATLSTLATIAMIVLVMAGITNARSKSRVVQALVLPTPVANVTPTLTIPQRTQSLWAQVDVAWTKEDWDTAVDVLERIRTVDPYNDDVRKRLGEAYYGRGVKLIQANKLGDAQAALDWAVRYEAGDEALQKVRRELKLYLDGLDAYWVRDWRRAVDNLKKVYEADPSFRDTRVMLGQAYFGLGVERQAAEVWDEARDAYKASLDLMPDQPDARSRLTAVMNIIIPPKRIEVFLKEQRVTLYEAGKPIHVFTCCTGRGTAPTLPGRYEILDKMPNAYASKWDLQMPWWLGIYWAGGSENGFHALPILSNGTTLWRGSLGKPCSFGCIVLDTPDAITLYNWVDLGTAVLVNP
jgi:tetratricopeptide (TPR) repeat protein